MNFISGIPFLFFSVSVWDFCDFWDFPILFCLYSSLMPGPPAFLGVSAPPVTAAAAAAVETHSHSHSHSHSAPSGLEHDRGGPTSPSSQKHVNEKTSHQIDSNAVQQSSKDKTHKNKVRQPPEQACFENAIRRACDALNVVRDDDDSGDDDGAGSTMRVPTIVNRAGAGDAIAAAREALDIVPASRSAAALMSYALWVEGRDDVALKLARRVVLASAAAEADPPPLALAVVVECTLALGDAEWLANNNEAARALYDEANEAATCTDLRPANRIRRADALSRASTCAAAAAAAGQHDAALTELETALLIETEQSGGGGDEGQQDAAFAWFLRARPSMTAALHARRAESLQALLRWDEASAEMDMAIAAARSVAQRTGLLERRRALRALRGDTAGAAADVETLLQIGAMGTGRAAHIALAAEGEAELEARRFGPGTQKRDDNDDDDDDDDGMAQPWHVLGVPEGASAAQVRTAFRKLALELHPDKRRDDGSGADAKAAEARFQQVLDAYHKLCSS